MIQKQKTITVFTPTYNRGYCLHRVYESLLRQSNKDFIWLVIDDGSTDTTKDLVATWILEAKIEIQYIYQANQGMHGGYNTAFKIVSTELVVCMDSDDYFTDEAIQLILDYWSKNKSDKFAGIIGLDGISKNEVLGKLFPQNLKSSTLEDIYNKYKVVGDKKLIYRSDVVKQFDPYPIFKNESFVPLGSLYLQIDKHYELLCLNKILCVVEYMDDGSTRNIFKQYIRHPRGFRYSRIIEIKYSNYFKVRFKAAIHYVANSIQLNKYNFFDNNFRLLIFFALPFGILLSNYIKYRNKN
jgi:glycosyltransferase involved in cell wall biosynthesis